MPHTPHPSFHAFAALACVSGILTVAGIWQGGIQGWTAAAAMFLVTAGFIGCAYLAFIAPRDDE
jgi:uncharacterized membrane protein